LKELLLLVEKTVDTLCLTLFITNKQDLKEKILKLILMELLQDLVMMVIGFLYKIGLHVLLLVAVVPKLYIENVCHLLEKEKIVKENPS
jgi:hypothetical protein